ncbi:MAG: LamG domain-containing protein, partial [Candidatus Omnitrophica bacterium]|nr:LamG domain-containing protein [Candidatus Omnitrophota bacterium]
MKEKNLWLVISFLFSLAFGQFCLATDVAFWNEYSSQKKDENVYLYLSFNDPEIKEGEGQIASVEAIGDASSEVQGRFGRCLKLGGKGALKCNPLAIFPGGFVAIEAWIKLERLPEKEAMIVFRPAEVDRSAIYNPAIDVTKGFALLVDNQGALHLETVNCFYGNKTRTSSPQGMVPVNQWVHVAGVSAVFPISFRRLYINGQEVTSTPIAWGQGLMVSGDEEKKPGPVFIGNNQDGTAGLTGLIDQVRIHRNVFKFWPKEETSWCQQISQQEIPDGSPYFLPEHKAVIYLPLDGTSIAASQIEKLTVKTESGGYEQGVRNQGFAGKLTISAAGLLPVREGAIEFWMQPIGFNNHSDRNVGIINAPFTLYIFNGGNPPRPLSLYFPKADGNLHFVNDGLGTEYHPGRWYHILITWKDLIITMYVDGKKAGRTLTQGLDSAFRKEAADALVFNAYGKNAIVDEVRIYHKALLPEEVVNAWARYRDRSRLITGIFAPSVILGGEYLASDGCIWLRFLPEVPEETIKEIEVTLKDARNKVLVTRRYRLGQKEYPFETGRLVDGDYQLEAVVVTKEGKRLAGGSFPFVRKYFPWENNKLGITETIYPPFQPLKTSGQQVSLVGRKYRFNRFGLPEEVVTLDRNILAEPVGLHLVTSGGETSWKNQTAGWEIAKAHQAVFKASGETDTLGYQTTSTVEID